MSKVLAIYVDAFDTHHISNDTPLIQEWDSQGHTIPLQHLFAFKGISAAMYGGVPPKKSGVWMDFKINSEPDPKLGDLLLSITPLIPSGLAKKAFTVGYERIVRNSNVTPHRIPRSLRPYFEPHPKKSTTEEGALGDIPTIFDILRREGISFKIIGKSGGPQNRIFKKLSSIEDFDEDLILIKFTLLDHVGHKHGPSSSEFKESLQRIDEAIEEAYKKTDRSVVIYSDHGMQEVSDAIDLRGIMRSDIGLNETQDFVAFYNSTCALVRWLSEGAKEAAKEYINDHDGLSFLTEDQLERMYIGATSYQFADDIIATEPGTVVSPDFYRKSAPEGMHGFTDNPNGGPIAIIPDKNTVGEGNLWDLAPTMMEFLGQEPPAEWKGESLLE